jgi:hypothetical protein
LQYPCNGGGHNCGQLISGCVWDTRNELIVTEPANYQDINTALYLGMMIVRGQQTPGASQITPFITLLYVTLDDDDSDLGNGTPHYCEIAAGFGAHNMDAPPLDPAVLDDFQIAIGTHLAGDLDSLENADNVRMRIRSGFGNTVAELHKMEMVVSGIANTCGTPNTVDVTFEGRVNAANGRAFLSLRNWNTGQFEQIGQFNIAQSDTNRQFTLPAQNYVNANGSIDLRIKTVVPSPQLSFTYETQIDHVEFSVQ